MYFGLSVQEEFCCFSAIRRRIRRRMIKASVPLQAEVSLKAHPQKQWFPPAFIRHGCRCCFLRHSAEKLNAQEERLATSPQLMTRLHLPHAIVVRLHVRKGNVVILTPEMAGPFGV